MSGCSDGCKEECIGTNLSLGHDHPELFVTSQWLAACSCSRTFYVVYRVLVALFWVSIVIASCLTPYDWFANIHDTGREILFIYVTTWSLVVLTLDVIIQAIVTVFVAVKFKRKPAARLKMTWYIKMQWIIANISTCTGFLISVAYWIFYYRPNIASHYVEFSTHGINGIYILLNMYITAMPIRIYHVFHVIIFTLLYITFSAVYQAAGGKNYYGKSYIYVHMDWIYPAKAGLNAFLLGIIGVTAVWLLVYGLYRLRLIIFKRLMIRRSILNGTAGLNNFITDVPNPAYKYVTPNPAYTYATPTPGYTYGNPNPDYTCNTQGYMDVPNTWIM